MSMLSNTLGGLLGTVSGADYAQNRSNAAYQQALDQLGPGGTAAAKKYGDYETAALKPQFKTQDQQLSAFEAANGTAGSGAASNDLANLGAQQSAVLAGSEAPLFSQGLGAYTGLVGEEPGAGNQAYQQALQNFYGAAETAAGGVPTGGGGAGAAPGGTPPMFPQSAGVQSVYDAPMPVYSNAQPESYPSYQPPANTNPYGPQG